MNKKTTIDDCRIIDLRKINDPRGNLTPIEGESDVPFAIKKASWIYDVPGDSTRGSHAFFETEELVVALSGSFDVVLSDGEHENSIHLNRSYKGVFIPKMIWRQMRNFSTNSVALVLSNTDYCPDDYIRDYTRFIAEKTNPSERVSNSIPGAQSISNSWHVKRPTVYDCSVIQLPKYSFAEGNLTVVHNMENIPFDIKRAFFLYDIPGGESRGAHAHKQCHQFLVAASGAFEVVLDDGINKRTVMLNRPFMGIHVPPGIWAAEQGFSSGSICLVLTSEVYNNEDYIRDYQEFLNYKGL
jgi:dTDP-4-dehydrorhamnose 3,5-epimerase-like enzyme